MSPNPRLHPAVPSRSPTGPGPLALLGCALVAILACRPTAEPAPDTFRYHLVVAPSTLDPARVNNTYSLGVVDRLFDGLMRLDRVRGVPEPELASSFEISEDQRVYTFRLHSGRTFHDGREIRAADVKASWERLLAPATASPQHGIFDLVEGVEAFREGQESSVAGIEVLGPETLRVRLRQPFALFLYHLTHPAASVVPVEQAQALGEDFGHRPVGSGPFRLVSWNADGLELEAFEAPGRPRPQVRRLVYVVADRDEALRRYRDGELDLVSDIPSSSLESLRQTLPQDLRVFPQGAWWGFCFRCDRPPFDDPRVRRALALAIDREALVTTLGSTQFRAARGLVPQSSTGHDSATLGAGLDLPRARVLLAEAGFPDGQGFPPLGYVTRQGELEAQVANFLLEQWAGLGIEGTVRPLDFEALLEARIQDKLTIYRWSWLGDFPDPEDYLRQLFYQSGSWNHFAYRSPEVDRLLDAAQRESDPERRLTLFRDAERQILDDAPCVGLYQKSQAILLQPGWRAIPIGYHEAHLEIERARWDPVP